MGFPMWAKHVVGILLFMNKLSQHLEGNHLPFRKDTEPLYHSYMYSLVYNNAYKAILLFNYLYVLFQYSFHNIIQFHFTFQ